MQKYMKNQRKKEKYVKNIYQFERLVFTKDKLYNFHPDKIFFLRIPISFRKKLELAF